MWFEVGGRVVVAVERARAQLGRAVVSGSRNRLVAGGEGTYGRGGYMPQGREMLAFVCLV